MAVRSTLPRLGRLLGRTRFTASILPIRRCAGGSSGYESSEEEDNVTELTRHKWDVTISGAGLAGAALACALGEGATYACFVYKRNRNTYIITLLGVNQCPETTSTFVYIPC